LIHYGEVLWGFDKSTRRALGQLEESETVVDLLPHKEIEYDLLKATELGREIECSLCTMAVNVCRTVPLLFLLG
jgi:hypothetical protein